MNTFKVEEHLKSYDYVKATDELERLLSGQKTINTKKLASILMELDHELCISNLIDENKKLYVVNNSQKVELDRLNGLLKAKGKVPQVNPALIKEERKKAKAEKASANTIMEGLQRKIKELETQMGSLKLRNENTNLQYQNLLDKHKRVKDENVKLQNTIRDNKAKAVKEKEESKKRGKVKVLPKNSKNEVASKPVSRKKVNNIQNNNIKREKPSYTVKGSNRDKKVDNYKSKRSPVVKNKGDFKEAK